MGKAILVMDMPSSCSKCHLSKEINTFLPEGICCSFNNQKVMCLEKPDWCPLRELPEKKEADIYTTAYDKATMIGYNACIDEILGGAK